MKPEQLCPARSTLYPGKGKDCLKKYATPIKSLTYEGMQPGLNSDLKTRASADPAKCSLLIPDLDLGYFNLRCKESGSRKAYLHHLIGNYLPLSGTQLRDLKRLAGSSWLTHYQKQNLNLQKRNFVPDPLDWECLRQAACGLGVSMCFLFVFLMHLEADGDPTFAAFPAPVERSSTPIRRIFRWWRGRKLVKFSILERKVNLREHRLYRKFQIR